MLNKYIPTAESVYLCLLTEGDGVCSSGLSTQPPPQQPTHVFPALVLLCLTSSRVTIPCSPPLQRGQAFILCWATTPHPLPATPSPIPPLFSPPATAAPPAPPHPPHPAGLLRLLQCHPGAQGCEAR